MFGLFSRKIFSNISQQVLSGLIVAVIVWLPLIAIDVKAQTSLDPANLNVEEFFDPQYRNFARCIKEMHFNNNQIRDYDGDTFASIHLIGPEHQKYKIDAFEKKCSERGINIGVNLNNPSSVENFQKVAHCLDEIQFTNGNGWYQIKEDRIVSCIDVTKQTLSQFRQPYLDCIIKEKYNPSTGYLDKNTDSLNNLCPTEKQKFSIFPRNIVDTNFDSFASLMSCLDNDGRKPKFDNGTWTWENSLSWVENPTGHCRYTIRDVFEMQMKTPSQLGISPFGGGNQISLPDLSFNPIIIDIPTEQTCWIGKEDKNAGPNLTNIWNPGNWLPIMYKCQNTTPDGRPIPLHPINFIPIAIRLFAFITSLLIWLIILNLVIGVILFIVGVTTSILAWVKKILIGSVAVVIVLIFMYSILYFILSIFQG